MTEDTSTVLSRANGTTSGPLQPLTPVEEGESPESFDDTRGQSVPSRTPSGSIRPSFPTKLKSARLMRTPVKDQSTLLTEIAGSEQADDDVEVDIFFDEDYDSFDETDIFEDIIKPDGEVIGHEEEDDPGILSDETELEVDIEGILNPDRVIHDTTGKTEYIRACQREATTPISLFLRKIQQKHFIMRYRGLGPNGAKALSVPLESNTTIERLDLEGNSIEARGAVYLANMLKENYYISEMMLAENKIGNQGVKALCDVLQDYHTVTKLDVSGNAIDDDAAPFLQEMLKKNSSLKHLNLSHNSIGNVGAKMFKEVLSDNESLESLDLSWNEIRTQGMIWLAEGIQENIGLKYLNVCMNGMCLEGAREMGKALKQNRSLLELDISYNRIPLDACVFIAAGVQANDTLQTLRMGSNPLSDDGSLAMLTALEKNDSTALTCLDLSNIVVTGAFERLRIKLTEEKQVRVIHGGVVGSTLDVDFTDSVSMIDPLEAFRRDPMSKVKQYVQAAGLRMLDLFKQFDKDNSMTVTKAEFVKGITKADLGLSADQIDILISRMDKDGDGEIDFGELIYSDKEYREKQREMKKLQLELERRNKSPQDKDNDSTTSA